MKIKELLPLKVYPIHLISFLPFSSRGGYVSSCLFPFQKVSTDKREKNALKVENSPH